MLRLEEIHPAIVHFPIVLVLCLFTIDFVAATKGQSLARGSRYGDISTVFAVAAALFAALAYFFGDQAYDIAVAANAPAGPLEVHEELGTITAAAIGLWGLVRLAMWWRNARFATWAPWGVVAVEIVLCLLLFTTAYFGGRLVYDYGVAVSLSAQ